MDGLLLRCGGKELLVEVTRKRGLPFIALWLDTEAPDVPAIDIDDFSGARDGARHLLSLGHRRLATLGIGIGEEAGLVTPEAARARPPPTTVAQPYARIAEGAGSAILDGPLPRGREVLPPTLVVRESTGPA